MRAIFAMCMVALIVVGSCVSAAGPGTASSFSMPSPAKYGVYVADVETGKIRYYGNVYTWSVSPDGKWIAGNDGGDVYAFSVATGKKTLLKRFPAQGAGLCPEFGWSDDSNDKPTVDILAVQAGAQSSPRPKTLKTTEAPIIPAPSFKIKGWSVGAALFSPDKTRVAAICTKGDYTKPGYQGGIFLCDPNGSHAVQVTRFVFKLDIDPEKYSYKTDAEDREIQWLPNGKGIAFRRTSHEDEGI